jgi:uncharacterized protein (TIGR02646 family)
MIYIDRSKIKLPEVLGSSRVEKAREQAKKRFLEGFGPSTQQRYEFDDTWYREVRIVLTEALYGKCAYCESKVSGGAILDMEHFRPIRSIAEARYHTGYWWLAYEWLNILAVCRNCNSSKGNRFPLETERLRARNPGEERREDNLLLDPTVDDPSVHLVFNLDGTASSETNRGQGSIAVLDLNRASLVQARLAKVRHILTVIKAFQAESNSTFYLSELRGLCEAPSEYAGLARQMILPILAKSVESEVSKVLKEEWQESSPTISKARRKRVKTSFKNFETSQSSYSLDNKVGQEKFRLQRRQIETISIRNFKSLSELELQVAPDAEQRSSWLMLLGENGTGKSSILQAVAMTMMGVDYFVAVMKEQGLDVRDFVSRGFKTATIKVKISGFIAPHKLTITKDRAVFRQPNGDEAVVIIGKDSYEVTGTRAEAQIVLLGYGATRLLRHKDDEHYGLPNCRVDNLFDPLKPLLNAEKWLLELKKSQFDSVAIVLKDLLLLENEATLIRRAGRVFVNSNGVIVTLKQLSDGYQSVIALTVDILEVAMRLWPIGDAAEGIVLLDEIGSHLHPTWRMRIVDSLRRAFPRLEFIVTTHEPLCLRGIHAGEIVVLRRNENHRIEMVKDLPSPADFRVDQLLTSEFFGLDSTTDPLVEAEFDEYYALLAMESRASTGGKSMTTEETARLADLKIRLRNRRYVGETPREQLMFEAIDKLLDRQNESERVSVPQLREDAVAQISKIWEEE